MDKDGTITISNWQAGIGDSPYTGFADVRNCEIHYPAGVLKIALAPSKISGVVVQGIPTWMTADRTSGIPGTIYFGGYTDTNIYSYVDATSTCSTLPSASLSGGTGGGIFYKGYLVVVDVPSLSGTGKLKGLKSGTWYTLGTTENMNGGDVAPVYWAQDDKLYIGVQKYVDRLSESTTFDPSSSGTYSFQGNVLDIFNYYRIDSIAEIGVNLYFGASKRQSGSVIQDSFDGRIFPWNTTDPSFKLPIIMDKGGVKQMISRNGQVTFANGRKGNFITTNGSLTQEIPEIGLLKNNPQNVAFDIYPQAADFINGEYLFGVSTSSTNWTPAGIYGFKNGAWRFLEISTGSTGSSSTVGIGCIQKNDDTTFFVGWQDGASYGIDFFGQNGYYYTGYRARVDTQLYNVGTAVNPHQFNKVDITLGKPLATGQGIRLSYRTSLSDSFTVMGTYDFATYGAVTGIPDGAQLPAVDNVQFRIELTTGVNSTTTPELVSVRIGTNKN